MSWLRIAVVSSLIAGGCAGDALEVGETEQAVRPSPGDGDGGCPVWGCGSNSPEIDNLGFHELNEWGQVNLEGFKIVHYWKYSTTGVKQYWVPDVINAELVGRGPEGEIELPANLVGGSVFDIVNLKTGVSYELRVAEVGRTPYWAKRGRTTVYSRTYRLEWRPAIPPHAGATPYINVCKNPNPADGASGFYAVLFDDDRINADDIRVTGMTRNWFNIGCGGHALSKQHLTGHTKAAGVALGITTSINQRTANLKMFAADYCGNGDPFTVAGQPLQWRDEFNWFNDVSSTASVEARWNENGAMCLSVPRIDHGTTMLGTATFPDGVEPLLDPAHVPQWCAVRPPPCDQNPAAMLGAHTLSANP